MNLRRAVLIPPLLGALVLSVLGGAPAQASAGSTCGATYYVASSAPINVTVAGVVHRVGVAYVARDSESTYAACQYAELDFSRLPSTGTYAVSVSSKVDNGNYAIVQIDRGSFASTDKRVTPPVYRFGISGGGSAKYRASVVGKHAPVKVVKVAKSAAQKSKAKKAYKKALKKASKLKSKAKRNKAKKAAKKKYKAQIAPTKKTRRGTPQSFTGGADAYF